MELRELVALNKMWSSDTNIFVLDGSSRDAASLRLSVAVSLYGHSMVLWFRGDVVMLA